jgi:hypothetical protein
MKVFLIAFAMAMPMVQDPETHWAQGTSNCWKSVDAKLFFDEFPLCNPTGRPSFAFMNSTTSECELYTFDTKATPACPKRIMPYTGFEDILACSVCYG